MPNLQLPELPEIEAARGRIGAHAHWTPMLSSRSIGELSNTDVWLKCENLQKAGAFKFRGAMNACLRAVEEEKMPGSGVITFSSGNHGQAVALAAKTLGIDATIVVPEDIPSVKRAAIEAYGARLEIAGFTSTDRHRRALEIAEKSGGLIIPPFDHPDVIAGQGTTGLEIIDELPEVDAILVPTGGGGLLAGVAIALSHRNPSTRVIAVEPVDANAMALSVEAGEIVSLDSVPKTIADGLKPMAPGKLTLEATLEHVDRVLLVDDESILRAQRLLLERAKLLVEPSGAAGVAALLGCDELAGLRVVTILTGGNTDLP
ncbi:MAG: threonine/serine dehydratase [Planctomycetota bacterium]|nr:threonine/serine dehydratase [Planctomycetota bacterium]